MHAGMAILPYPHIVWFSFLVPQHKSQRGVADMALLSRATDFLWNPWLLGLFLLTGCYFSVRTGFPQVFGFRIWWKQSIGSILRKTTQRSRHGISQFQALSTALAATIGTGSIAGVATAIFYGGPGAIFWMWISAFLGMMTGCAEKTLSIRYRCKNKDGCWQGGPMYYIDKGLGCRPLAILFCIFCIIQTTIGGNLVQSNSISTALNTSFGFHPFIVGIVISVLIAIVVLGGIQRIGKVSERLVPCMALLFLLGSIVVLICHASSLPDVIRDIFSQAFSGKAACGGYGASVALRYGVARGVFTNEAGLGSSAMAHAAADVDDPAQQGMWGIFEVFFATLVVCTMTAFVILSSGVYDQTSALSAIASGQIDDTMLGAPLSVAAYSTVFGSFGSIFISVCLILFAFTTLLGACYYGELCISYLTNSQRIISIYRILYLSVCVLGSIGDLSVMWLLVDFSNALMALPNLIALLLLSSEAIKLINQFFAKNS